MAGQGSVAKRIDPLMAHNFVISLLDSSSLLAGGASNAAVLDAAVGGFSECTGLEMSLDVEEYREGGRNSEVLQFPTRIRWAKITLKKGIATDTSLWDWHYSYVEGKGNRRDGLVVLLDDQRSPIHIWHFRRGLPVRYLGPALNAGQNNVAIEGLEIVHEGIYRIGAVSGQAV